MDLVVAIREFGYYFINLGLQIGSCNLDIILLIKAGPINVIIFLHFKYNIRKLVYFKLSEQVLTKTNIMK